MPTEDILKHFALFSLGGDGISGWLTQNTDEEVFRRLDRIDHEPLSKVQLNQLLAFGHEAPLSDEFFRYYWLDAPSDHPYPVTKVPGFHEPWPSANAIQSLEHLKWGLYRLYTDALLYFGNVRTAYRTLRELRRPELVAFFARKTFDTNAIKQRGPALPLQEIPKDDRYLISEMACKSFGSQPETPGEMRNALVQAYHAHVASGGKAVTWRDLITGQLPANYSSLQEQFLFSADDILEESILTQADFDAKFERVASAFFAARRAAIVNTRRYLSMVSDLDVYVATSMRTREDFRRMGSFCEEVFQDEKLRDLHLRYFDPTLSAAEGHEDKGLIECLMVKCAKVLIYCAGEKDSYGKDAEAAMALSLGKPVIFYCDEEKRRRFYRDVHPLSRLIEFDTGVAVGAMVTDAVSDVSALLHRLFENKMEYELEQPKPGYLRLKERLTQSVVRLQTNDRLLTETFWNQYHSRGRIRANPPID
jgi:hypothetical protein